MKRLPDGLRKITKEEFVQALIAFKEEEELLFDEKPKSPKSWTNEAEYSINKRISLRW